MQKPIVIIDNYDSFTYNLVDYLLQLYPHCIVVQNDTPIKQLITLNPLALVLSPGPGKPREAGLLMEIIDYFSPFLPILGVCLGHQALGEYFGATLRKGDQPMHGKISPMVCFPDKIFSDLPPVFNVVRYHSLVIEADSLVFKIIGKTILNEVMAIRHCTLPLIGFQFHPEAILTEFGLALLRNWLNEVMTFDNSSKKQPELLEKQTPKV